MHHGEEFCYHESAAHAMLRGGEYQRKNWSGQSIALSCRCWKLWIEDVVVVVKVSGWLGVVWEVGEAHRPPPKPPLSMVKVARFSHRFYVGISTKKYVTVSLRTVWNCHAACYICYSWNIGVELGKPLQSWIYPKYAGIYTKSMGQVGPNH